MQEGPVELQDGCKLLVSGQECFEGQRGWLVVKDKLRRGHLLYDHQAQGMPWFWCWEDSRRQTYTMTQLRQDEPFTSRLRLTNQSAYTGAHRYPHKQEASE